MTKRAKIGWLYLIAAIFVAVALYLMVNKNNYLFFAVPVVLGILLLYIFSLDKVMMLISFLVPSCLTSWNSWRFLCPRSHYWQEC